MINLLVSKFGKFDTSWDCMWLSAPSADLEAVKCRIK